MSQQIPILRGIASKGEPIWDRPGAWKFAMGVLEGKRFEVSIQRERKKRSNNQNAYYWGCVIPTIAAGVGYNSTEEEHQLTHDGLRMMFLRVPGPGFPTARSTTSLSTVEFEDYMRQCRQYGAERGVYVCEPNEWEPL